MIKNIIRLFTLFFLIFFYSRPLLSFDKVVIWGHKLHSHTHSYIHNGFYRAFQYLGYSTYWLDDEDDIKNFDFSNTLFLTEGQVDHNIPIRQDCLYILHYCQSSKYSDLIDQGKAITMQVYNDNLCMYDSLGNMISGSQPDMNQLLKVDTCLYYDFKGFRVFMPWATDLLPYEIDHIKATIDNIPQESTIFWVGTLSDGPGGNKTEITPFIKACQENGIAFVHKDPWSLQGGISVEDNIVFTRRSYMAPAIVGTWQKKVGYIPCRIFKNISYGKMGFTNSKVVYELFDKKIVYNPDTYKLFYDAQEKLKKLTQNELFELMDFVKNKHTYINRINFLLDFFELLKFYTEVNAKFEILNTTQYKTL